MSMRSLIALSAVLAIGLATPPASAQAPKPVLKDFGVDWMKGTRPRDPYADQKGRVWFVGQTGNYIGRIEPSTGEVTRFEIDAGTGPHNLVVDPKGTVWFTGNRNNRLVKMDPETGKLTTYMIPDSTVRDPHTMIWDSKGQYAWFTAQRAAVVGRFTAATGEFKLWKMAPRTNPYGIVVDAKGRPWFDLFGTNKIGTIDPATLEFREYVLPDPASRPRRIGLTSDGGVWYGDYGRGYLGRLDPATGKTEEFPLPSGARSLPYGMTVDDRDRVWVAETGVQPNRLVSFDTKKRVFEDQITIGQSSIQNPNTIRHMMFDPATKTIWFGQDIGFIGSLKVPTVVVP
jgi:virginiamycin B lyase